MLLDRITYRGYARWMILDERYKKRLFRAYLAVAVVPAIFFFALGGISIFISYSFSSRSARVVHQATLGQVRDALETVVTEIDSIVLGMSTDPEFSTSAHRFLDGRVDDYADSLARSVFLSSINMAVNTRLYLRSIYVSLGPSEEYLAVSIEGILRREDFSDAEWAEGHPASRDEIGVEFEPRDIRILPGLDVHRRVLSLYRNMFYAGTLRYNGLIVANIDVDYLERLMQDGARRLGGRFVLLDDRGRIVVESGILKDTRPIRSEVRFERYPFTLVSEASRSSFYSLSRTLVWTNGLLILAALAAGILAAYCLSRRSFRSIVAVVDIINAAEKDEPLPAVEIPAKSGYHHLVYTIMKTFVERRFLKIQLSERELRQKTLELMALQSQTNPHFLYNTLTTIAFKTIQYTGGPNDATRMVNHLSRILGYALVDPDRPATLGAEIENLRDYVAIQEYRYKDLFSMEWDLGPKALECASIRMLIQPLVENAIDHGIRGADRRGRIRVSCQLQGDTVTVSVADNGVGMDAAKLEEIRDLIESNHLSSEKIGLVNTCRRLRLRYGAAGGYELQSVPNEGTRIILFFPAERIVEP